MKTLFDIPRSGEHTDAIHRVFEQFLIDYQPILFRVETYLDEVIEKTDQTYKEAYIPWKNAVHELLSGAYLVAKKIPLPNKDSFIEALSMFSFEGAITFLRDICNICQLQLKNGWRKEFQDNINQLLFSISILNQQQQNEHGR